MDQQNLEERLRVTQEMCSDLLLMQQSMLSILISVYYSPAVSVNMPPERRELAETRFDETFQSMKAAVAKLDILLGKRP